MLGHVVGGRLVEGRQLTTHLGRQLLGFDIIGQPGTRRPVRVRVSVTELRRPAVPIGARPSRCLRTVTLRPLSPPCVAVVSARGATIAALPVVDHWNLSYETSGQNTAPSRKTRDPIAGNEQIRCLLGARFRAEK
ncbi:hypothetical protein MAUB_09360 [Mycolicibacterium aubagnense]|uniref:Uncharacterized protein n=1 Tax=Mycolicibacterium aubagnense TaxID=319707 RepID=A0ABN5YN52_9MYCO|nr:hypothetical protein MAUB_09360 [Mycolicibacterium aubagnense]